MSFRQKRDAWRDFLREHEEELRACGVPAEVYRERLRFLVFLEHGYDEWAWAENPHGPFFRADTLSDEQLARLTDFAVRHFSPSYQVSLSSRWQRG